MTELDSVYTGLIAAIAQEVGSRLATTDGAGGTKIPAIFREYSDVLDERSDFDLLPFPRISIRTLATKEVGGWLKNKEVDENDRTIYTYEYQALLLISCRVSSEDEVEDALDILSDLKKRFSFDRVRQKIFEASGGVATFQRSNTAFGANTFDDRLKKERILPSMEVTINFTTTLVDDESSVIDSTVIEGNLTETIESSPITPTIIVP